MRTIKLLTGINMSIFLKWICPILIIIVGVYFQLNCGTENCLALARAGCLVVVFGVTIESKYVLRIVGDEVYSGTNSMTIGKVPSPKNFKEGLSRGADHIGLVWALLGTLLWGFGDLL
jgi:hypothetical protein